MNNEFYDSIFDAIAGNVPEPITEAFTAADGVKRCVVCGGALETIVEFNGIQKTVPCICKCEKERRDKEEREKEAAQRRTMSRLLAFHDDVMKNWTFENDNGNNPRIFAALKNYVANFETLRADGRGLLLYGNVGTGKTYAAASVANALIDRDYSVLMTNFSRITNDLQESFNGRNKKIDKLNENDLLIIDDLAAERQTDYMNEIIYSVIDARYRINKPLIITTNLTMDCFKNPPNVATARIYDRIIEKCFPIEVNGVSQRRAKIAAEYNDIKNILGL